MGFFSTAAKAIAAAFCVNMLHALRTNTSVLVHYVLLDTVLDLQ